MTNAALAVVCLVVGWLCGFVMASLFISKKKTDDMIYCNVCRSIERCPIDRAESAAAELKALVEELAKHERTVNGRANQTRG